LRKLMIESIMATGRSFLNDCHCSEVFLLACLVGQPGVSSGYLKARVPQEMLQTLKPHPGIQELACKGVAETMDRIAFVGKACFFQVNNKPASCCGIGQPLIFYPAQEDAF